MVKTVFGGARRDRTADLYNAIVALSQLSYGPVKERELRREADPLSTPAFAIAP